MHIPERVRRREHILECVHLNEKYIKKKVKRHRGSMRGTGGSMRGGLPPPIAVVLRAPCAQDWYPQHGSSWYQCNQKTKSSGLMNPRFKFCFLQYNNHANGLESFRQFYKDWIKVSAPAASPSSWRGVAGHGPAQSIYAWHSPPRENTLDSLLSVCITGSLARLPAKLGCRARRSTGSPR